jgi:hypothetical protein
VASSQPSSFEIEPEQTLKLEIGDYPDQALGCLRTLLPPEQGFTTARTI